MEKSLSNFFLQGQEREVRKATKVGWEDCSDSKNYLQGTNWAAQMCQGKKEKGR
jgi:hypothetical protein